MSRLYFLQRVRLLAVGALAAIAVAPASSWACAACYGQSDSPLAAGMNWGIMSLLGTIIFVLGGVAGFFLFLARRSVGLRAQAEGRPEQLELQPLKPANENPAPFHRGVRPRKFARHRLACGSFFPLIPLRQKRARLGLSARRWKQVHD